MTSSNETQSKGSMLHQFGRIGMRKDRIWIVPLPITPLKTDGAALGINDQQSVALAFTAVAPLTSPDQSMTAKGWPESLDL